jgi:thiamine biosynthesis lipoprotein
MSDSEHDLNFHCMGSDMRVLVGEPLVQGMPAAAAAAESVRAFLVEFDDRLSRFKPDSELSALNRDPRYVVPAPALLRSAVRAALWAAERTGGLVDPTLVGELEVLGYASSRDGQPPAALTAALAAAPPRHPAHPNPGSRWREIHVNDRTGTVIRPAGVLLDTGGCGKGLAADMAARLLRGYARFVVDCGGDLRIGGPGAEDEPYEIEVEHPLTGERVLVLRVGAGGVATSGINVRLWRADSGRFAHHLLDPETGEPAWTGLAGVTALGPTALEAETLAKAALLSGPEAARAWLADHGGLLVRDTGETERVGLRELTPARVRFVLPAKMRAA